MFDKISFLAYMVLLITLWNLLTQDDTLILSIRRIREMISYQRFLFIWIQKKFSPNYFLNYTHEQVNI